MRWNDIVTSALLIEVAVDKPGNVGPRHHFNNMAIGEFTRSAFAIGAVMQNAIDQAWPFGYTVYQAVTASLEAAGGVNVHLGTILMVTPLVLGFDSNWRQGIIHIIRGISLEDTDWTFRAMAKADPGGLDRNDTVHDDVFKPAARPLLEVFRSAAHYDWVAREYCRMFGTVFGPWSSHLKTLVDHGQAWNVAVWSLFMKILQEGPDSLWIRKNGLDAAERQYQRIKQVIAQQSYDLLPQLLEDSKNRWNPGTTADLVAASVLVTLVEGNQ